MKVSNKWKSLSHDEKDRVYSYGNADLVGIINYKNGNMIPVEYHEILIKHDPKEIFYWAKKSYSDYVQLDIYNEQMSIIRTLKYKPTRGENDLEDERMRDINDVVYPLELRNGMLGAISASRQTIIPFEFTKMDTRITRSYRNREYEVDYFIPIRIGHYEYSNDKEMHIFDLTGKKLSPDGCDIIYK
ncbi:MAG: hypothetical protein HRT57_16600 [Crocinitomicaceae bacterium]|nr:hypothetical protein [Crocinitomicaceae bacterium]